MLGGQPVVALEEPASLAQLGKLFVTKVSAIPQVLAVGIATEGTDFRPSMVIQDYDTSVCGKVFTCEAELYDVFPALQADFMVYASTDYGARAVLRGDGQGFLCTTPSC